MNTENKDEYRIMETRYDFEIINKDTGVICLIVPKRAYSDPRKAAEAFRDIIDVATVRKKGREKDEGT